jgi:hypothetical protein
MTLGSNPLYASTDWADRNNARRLMILVAEKFMPMVNAAIDSGERTAAE